MKRFIEGCALDISSIHTRNATFSAPEQNCCAAFVKGTISVTHRSTYTIPVYSLYKVSASAMLRFTIQCSVNVF